MYNKLNSVYVTQCVKSHMEVRITLHRKFGVKHDVQFKPVIKDHCILMVVNSKMQVVSE